MKMKQGKTVGNVHVTRGRGEGGLSVAQRRLLTGQRLPRPSESGPCTALQSLPPVPWTRVRPLCVLPHATAFHSRLPILHRKPPAPCCFSETAQPRDGRPMDGNLDPGTWAGKGDISPGPRGEKEREKEREKKIIIIIPRVFPRRCRPSQSDFRDVRNPPLFCHHRRRLSSR